MKTERFDDEFRRKLLGLPADTDAGEVDRIHTHVQTHLPTAPGMGWGKVLLVGGASLLLLLSLVYNFSQSYRNTHLQASLDSLTQVRRLAETLTKHDTVYITRSEKSTLSTGDELYGRLAGKPSKLANKPVHDTATSVETSAARTLDDATAHRRIVHPKPIASPPATETVEELANSGNRSPTSPFRNTAASSSIPRSTADAEFPKATPVAGISDTKRLKPAEFQTQRNTEAVVPAAGTTSLMPVTELNRQPVEVLASRQLNKATLFNKTLSTYRLATLPRAATTEKSRQRWHLTLPSISIPKAQYRLGGGLLGGPEDQLGGALLGEVSFQSHWSFQVGLRVLYSQGFHYRNDQDFDDHQDDDFRQVYAPQLPLTTAIADIQQASVIAQVPVQLAYHYPLNKQWGLRLGIGTDLDLWGRSIVSYRYQGSSRSPERGLTTVEPSIRWFNNVTINPAVEWYRNRWLFRAGPFISPQLRSVSYKPDDLSWGAHVQILYQLGK